MARAIVEARTKVADEVWIAACLLHRENPAAKDFAVEDIVARAVREGITHPLRPGVYVHVVQHCVANRPANPGNYRMLFETAPGRRRLYRKGDPHHPGRKGKVTPIPEEIPHEYRKLLSWYEEWTARGAQNPELNDSLLALYGSGRKLWADEHADEYVRKLRAGWE
jgi:hypothetical protein